MSGSGRRTIGNFTIERELGKGGMGVVLLGRHTSLERLAVLKRLRPELSSERGADRALRARGARRGGRPSPERGGGLRLDQLAGRALHRAGVRRRGRSEGGAARAGQRSLAGGGADRARARARPRGDPRPRHGAPRSQAGQRAARPQRRREDRRFRDRDREHRRWPHASGNHDRHAALRRTRADPGRTRRRARRSLRARRRALRAAGGLAALPRAGRSRQGQPAPAHPARPLRAGAQGRSARAALAGEAGALAAARQAPRPAGLGPRSCAACWSSGCEPSRTTPGWSSRASCGRRASSSRGKATPWCSRCRRRHGGPLLRRFALAAGLAGALALAAHQHRELQQLPALARQAHVALWPAPDGVAAPPGESALGTSP